MSRIIQVRGVPDQVHDALAEAAEATGLSLTEYLRRELVQLAQRSHVLRDNLIVVRDTQADDGGTAGRDAILSTLREGAARKMMVDSPLVPSSRF